MSRAFEVPLPERQGHRMLLGPFQNPTELLRALLGAGVGLLLALAVGPLEGLLLAGAFLALNLVRWRDECLWDLSRDALLYLARRRWPPGGADAAALRVEADLLVDPEGGRWAVWEVPLLPVSGHEPTELFTEALRFLGALPAAWGEIFLIRRAVPWRAAPPPRPGDPGTERLAWEGYRALLLGLTRNCYRHRWFVVLPGRALTPPASLEGPAPFDPPPGWHRIRGPDLRAVARWDEPIAAREPDRALPSGPPSRPAGNRSDPGRDTRPR